ncbi:MAG: hypothetical protein HY907_08930 [Deltaproteobacteria bacterium]|nr:hypothetical protein [Deltaproteobacteria bacterium]
MTRIGWLQTVPTLLLLADACGAGRGPTAGPAAGPEDPNADAATLAPAPEPDRGEAGAGPAGATVCLPLAICGCFSEGLCAGGRLRDDGHTIDITEGPHAGELGELRHDCAPTECAECPEDGPADCIEYLAQGMMVCRALAPQRGAKYVCAIDDVQPHYACGVRDGTCTRLAPTP